MSNNYIEDRLKKLEKQNKHLKLLIIFLIMIMLLSLISLVFFIQRLDSIVRDSSLGDKDIQRLEALINDNNQEYKNTIDILNSENDYLEETINKLIKPNLFSPWHIYDGRAGVWFIDENGEGKWLPNTYVEELTILLDEAIRDGYRKQTVPKEDTIEIFIYLDEEGPEEYITIDLNNNKIIYRNEQYSVTKEDIEVIKGYLNEKGTDGNSR